MAVAIDLMAFAPSPGGPCSFTASDTLDCLGNQEKRSCTVMLHYGGLL